MLTWSFACTSSPASVAMTSFAFMFEEVPEPVWKTSIGNWSSSSPEATRSAAAAIRAAMSGSSRSRSAFTCAAAPLIRPSQRAHGDRNRLAGDGEVGDRLARLAAPELPPRLGLAHVPSLAPSSWRGTLVAQSHKVRRATVPQRAPGGLAELALVGPPEVAAARALGVDDSSERGAMEPVLLAAAEAFDDRRHAWTIGSTRSALRSLGGGTVSAAPPRPGGRPSCRASRAVGRAARRRPSRPRRSPPSPRRARARRRARRGGRGRPRRSRAGSRPSRASSSRSSTVSVASFLFVPITPLGPRLIQPAT